MAGPTGKYKDPVVHSFIHPPPQMTQIVKQTTYFFKKHICISQLVKNLPAVQETQVQSQGREDPLEKDMAIHSSILAWRIPWTEEPGGLHSLWGRKELEMTE